MGGDSITSSKNRTDGRDRPLLLISASDSSGAAGMQVDIRVTETLNLPLRCSLTAVTVQGDDGVRELFPVPSGVLGLSIKTALDDPPGICAVKIGMLVDAATVSSVVESLKSAADNRIPVVLDPVVRSTSGSSLLDAEGADLLLERLLPLCTVVTPNREEALWLASRGGASTSDEEMAAEALLSLGVDSVLITGGEGPGDFCTDTLYTLSGSPQKFRHPRLPGPVPRGTGCALSSAIAANLGVGNSLEEAVEKSITFVGGLIKGSMVVGNQRLLFPKR